VTKAGLQEALDKLQGFKRRYQNDRGRRQSRVFNQALTFSLELGYLLDCGETIIRSAIVRTESRGAHTRTDFPERNDADWLKHILLTWRGEEEPELSYIPVTITKWKPEVRTY